VIEPVIKQVIKQVIALPMDASQIQVNLFLLLVS